MKAKKSTIACKLTMKNRIYLEMLGYIDGKTGKSKKDGPNISTLLNKLLTDMLESGKGYSFDVATPQQLETAYLDFNRKLKEKEMQIISDELKNIAIQLKEAKQ